MKKSIRIIAIMFIASMMISLQVPAAQMMPTVSPGDKDKPVKADDIQIVKKITVKGPGASNKPVKGPRYAATGIPGAAVTGTRYAIVIGISDYPGETSDLTYGDIDANAVTDILKAQYGFLQNNVVTLTNSEATKDGIQQAVNSIKSKFILGDELVFFFSGHGANGNVPDGDRSKDQSIVVWAGETDSAGFAYMWDGDLKALFSSFVTGSRIIFVFDSCLSGGMSGLLGAGRVVNMASTASGLSYEGAQWGHGQFTYYFAVEGLKNLKADNQDPDHLVSIEEAFDYAKANCQWQSPVIADGFANDLLP